MVSTTASAIIASALRLLNVLASGETLPVDMGNDALMAFQQMVDSWNADRLGIFTTGSNDFPFVANKQSYTLGSGGDFDMSRPPRIDGISTIILDNPANPIEVPMAMYSVYEWQTLIPVKSVPSSWPQICYDDGGSPYRTLNFWPYPNTSGNSVRIYSWQPLSLPASLATVIAFPPGYAKAFRYNLALDLAPEFSAPVPAEVAAQAVSSLAVVKTMNAPELTMRSDLVPTDPDDNYKAELFNIPF